MIPTPQGQFETPIVVTRPAAGGDYGVRGFYEVGGAPATINTTASVQPATGKDLLLLPEADRTKEAIKVYTATDLFTDDIELSRPADLIAYDGRMFKVKSTTPYKMGQLDHTKAIAVRDDEDAT